LFKIVILTEKKHLFNFRYESDLNAETIVNYTVAVTVLN